MTLVTYYIQVRSFSSLAHCSSYRVCK